MASKVLVKIPAVNFNSQVGKCSADLSSVPGPSSVNGGNRIPLSDSNSSSVSEAAGSTIVANISSDPMIHIAQLEQNIRFLKEQHHIMLTSLHQEVESLRQRNRDLQFQLVFSRGPIAFVKSSPSSPEDDSKPQILLSPQQVNVTPLQVEILERDVAELRTSLSEARTRNAYLQNIVDNQQKQLENAASGDSVEEGSKSPDPDLTFKLEEAEKLIRRLRRENDEQRRELAMIKANQLKAQGGPSYPHSTNRGGNHWGQQHRDNQAHHRRDNQHDTATGHEQHYEHQQSREASRFPPLPTQKYWHGGNNGRRWNHSWDSGRGTGSGSGHPGHSQGPRMHNQQSIPSLPALSNHGTSSAPAPAPAQFTLVSSGGGGRRGHRNNYRGVRNGNGSSQAVPGYRDQGYNQQT